MHLQVIMCCKLLLCKQCKTDRETLEHQHFSSQMVLTAEEFWATDDL